MKTARIAREYKMRTECEELRGNGEKWRMSEGRDAGEEEGRGFEEHGKWKLKAKK